MLINLGQIVSDMIEFRPKFCPRTFMSGPKTGHLSRRDDFRAVCVSLPNRTSKVYELWDFFFLTSFEKQLMCASSLRYFLKGRHIYGAFFRPI